jgi:hypothetical protein
LPFDYVRAHKLFKALFGEVVDLIKDKQLLLVPSGPLYAALAQLAREKQACAASQEMASVLRSDAGVGITKVAARGGFVDLSNIRIQVPLPETPMSCV